MKLRSILRFIYNHPLNQKRKLRAIAQFFYWQFYSRLIGGKKVHRFTDRSKLYISKGMTAATGNYYCGLLEVYEMSFLLHFLKEDDLFADIGANIGSYTILASAHARARSVSFEPSPFTFEHLKENIALNAIADKVELLNLAVGEEDGILKFTKGLDTVNHIATNDNNPTIDVKVVRLDDQLKEVPSLMKIDVEGFETPVIKGGMRVLKDPKLKAIIMELNGSGRKYGFNEDEILINLKELGFEEFSYDPFERRLIPVNHNSDNTIFIRDVEAVQKRLMDSEPISINGMSY